MKISSPAFSEGGTIPDKYTKYGENRIPPLHFDGVPMNARSIALVVDDPDAPSGTFNHWVLFNVDPKVSDIQENNVPAMATQGKNDFGEVEYGGPRPPDGEHRYFFRAYALDTVLALARGVERSQLEREMQNHVIESAELMGRYAH